MRAFKKRTEKDDLAHIEAVSQAMIQTPATFAPAQGEGRGIGTFPQVMEVPISELKDNPMNARRVVSPTGLDDLASSMLNRGQDAAALGYSDENGKICLIDGHRRLEAARIAGLEKLRVEIRPRPHNDQELYMASRSANVEREAQTPLDDALAWRMLLDRKVFESQADLARKLGLETTAVSRTLGLAELPRALITMLIERPELMTLRMLDAIKRFADVAGEEAAEALILEIEREGLSSRDVDTRRRSAERGPVSRARSDIQVLKFKHGAATIKRFASQGRLVVEVGEITDDAKLAELVDRMNGALAEILASS